MSIGDWTAEDQAKWKRQQYYILGWFIAGLVAMGGLYLYFWPPGPAMGVAYSPQRWMLSSLWAFLIMLPLWAWGYHYYIGHQQWLAEDMGLPYEEGKRYPIWTTRRVAACALGIALFGASGAVPASAFDLPQFVASFLTVLYGPIEGMIGVGLGFALIRGPIFVGRLDPFYLSAVCLGDGMIYAVMGNVYRKYIHYRPTTYRYLGVVLYYISQLPLHRGWWMLTFGSTTRPWEAFVPYVMYNLTWWIPFAYTPNVFLGYLAASAALKYKL